MPGTLRSGFTLVELAIVLAIIGLLAGGVLAGQSMLKASEVQAAATDLTKMVAAHTSFRDQYNAMPGDFNAATRYWGRQSSTAACVTNFGAAVNTDTGVCDGDSSGTVAGEGTYAAGEPAEEFQYWRQLQMAGFMEGGNYSGLNGSGASSVEPGVNVPAMKRTPSRWRAYSLGDTTGDTGSSTFGLRYNMTYHSGPNFTPKEVWDIDLKVDDGVPAAGNLIARPWYNCTTAATRTDLNGEYNFQYTTNGCSMMWRNLQ